MFVDVYYSNPATTEIETHGHQRSLHVELPIGAQTEQAVLSLQEDLLVGRQVYGYLGRQADAQVHVRALRDGARHALCHLLTVQAAHVLPPAATTRCTKMPGVTMASGSSSPSATTSATWAMVHLAAIALSGPKLREVLR